MIVSTKLALQPIGLFGQWQYLHLDVGSPHRADIGKLKHIHRVGGSIADSGPARKPESWRPFRKVSSKW